MRKIMGILIIVTLFSCSEEDINTVDGNWTRFIYETSDIVGLRINSQSNPTLAFRNNYIQILGAEGGLVEAPKENLADFDQLVGHTANSLEVDDLFVLGGVDRSGIDPVYGIKLMDANFNAQSFFHENVEEAFFMPGSMSSFYGLLRSPLFQGQTGRETNLTLVQYSLSGVLDTLSTQEITITGLQQEVPLRYQGLIMEDKVYFVLQSTLYRLNAVTGNLLSTDINGVVRGIALFENQIVVHRGGAKVSVFDLLLNKISENTLLGISGQGDEELKITVLKVFEADDRMFAITGLSRVEEIRPDYLAEVSMAIELLSLDENFAVTDRKTVLTGLEGDTELLWKKYSLISQDVRRGRFAVILFQRGLPDAKYEYLAKRINF